MLLPQSPDEEEHHPAARRQLLLERTEIVMRSDAIAGAKSTKGEFFENLMFTRLASGLMSPELSQLSPVCAS